MEMYTDKTGRTDWLSDAACAGLWDKIQFHWSEPPQRSSAAPALACCDSCPVGPECRQDMADRGERYPYQVRGGIRMWIDDEVSTMMPEPTIEYTPPEAPKRQPGRPATGFPKSVHLQEKYSLLGPDVNRDEYPTTNLPVAARRRTDNSNIKEGQDAKLPE